MSIKTHKSLAKRIRITKNGKIMKKKSGRGHFNARESSNVTRAKRRPLSMSSVHYENMKQLLPFS